MMWIAFVAAAAASVEYVDGSWGGREVAAIVATAAEPELGGYDPRPSLARVAPRQDDDLRPFLLSELVCLLLTAPFSYVILNTMAGMFAAAAVLLQGERWRRCTVCHKPKRLVEGERAHGLLGDGQRVERRLGSVLHEVFACPEHGEPVLVSRGVNSPYQPCSACGLRAALRTGEAATEGAPAGQALLTWACVHCQAVTQRPYPLDLLPALSNARAPGVAPGLRASRP